jgi:hypothetical protein
MPRNFVLLLAEWQNRGLEAFRDVVFRDASALTQAYGKRKYLYDVIVSTKEAAQSLEERAAILDVDLGTRSLSFCLRQLMAEDDTIVRRVKRRRIDPPPVEVDPEATPPRRPRPPPRHPRPYAHRLPCPPQITIDGVPRGQWMPNRPRGRWEVIGHTAPGRLTGLEGDFV